MKKWRLSNRRYTHRYQATIFRCELYIWPSIFDGTDILRKRVHSRKNKALTVHLTEKVIGAHITRKWNGNAEQFTFTVDKVPTDNETTGLSAFKTRKIENYKLSETEKESRTVYPVILPSGMEIDYIEATDVNGNIQKLDQ